MNNKIINTNNKIKKNNKIYTIICGIVINKTKVKLIKNKKKDISRYKIVCNNKKFIIKQNKHIFKILVKKKELNIIKKILKTNKQNILKIISILEINSLIKIKIGIFQKKKIFKKKH